MQKNNKYATGISKTSHIFLIVVLCGNDLLASIESIALVDIPQRFASSFCLRPLFFLMVFIAFPKSISFHSFKSNPLRIIGVGYNRGCYRHYIFAPLFAEFPSGVLRNFKNVQTRLHLTAVDYTDKSITLFFIVQIFYKLFHIFFICNTQPLKYKQFNSILLQIY